MATNKQKKQLVEALKFTPQQYHIRCWGYGGEVVMGTVKREVYDYFVKNEIDLEDFVNDWDNDMEVPNELCPFAPGEWHECDNLAHESGVEMNDACWIEITDGDGNTIWQSCLDVGALSDAGVELIETCETYASFQPNGTVVFYGQNFEKGTFFDQAFDVTSPFDHTKLTMHYEDIEGWPLLTAIFYRGEELTEGYDGYATTGKSSRYEFHVIGSDQD